MSFTTHKSLIDRVNSSDEEAWSDFYNRYYRLVFSIGLRFHLREDLCHDLVQQVMLIIFEKKLTFRYQPELGKFRTYLFTITKNVIHKIQRAEKISENTIDDPDVLNTCQSEEDNIFKEEWHQYMIETLLDDLRHKVEDVTFDAFQMYIFQGIRPEKIAKVLGISVSTVYVHKCRCLEYLKQLVKEVRRNDPDFSL